MIKFIEKKIISPLSIYLFQWIRKKFLKKKWADYTDTEREEFWNEELKMTKREFEQILQKFRKSKGVDVNTYIGANEFVWFIIKDRYK